MFVGICVLPVSCITLSPSWYVWFVNVFVGERVREGWGKLMFEEKGESTIWKPNKTFQIPTIYAIFFGYLSHYLKKIQSCSTDFQANWKRTEHRRKKI